MKVGGFQKFSLVDYPGLTSAIVFTQGCNLACGFCHNPELVDPLRFTEALDQEAIMGFLDKRRTQLQGVVITGGEPTLHEDLPDFLLSIKAMGYSIKLDTNGSRPQALSALIDHKLLDFVAMDIKGPLEAYTRIAGSSADPAAVKESISLILSRFSRHEFRTTYLDQLLTLEDLLSIGELLRGCARYVIQPFIPTKTMDERFLKLSRTPENRLREAQTALSAIGINCQIR